MTGDIPLTPASPLRSHAPLAGLLLLTAIRLAVAAATPLSPDEAYYWVWSRALAPGYLDHPPMVALWIWLGTALAGDTPLGVRLLAPFSAALGSVLLARAAEALFPHRSAGLHAAILLNATLMFGAGSVTMTPDTPLLFFWTAGAYFLARIATGAPPSWWLAVGATAGLALDSKYTAALLGLGIALWLLTPAMRWQLRTPWPWAGGALAATLFLPVLQWNATHAWASFAKQGGRTADWAPAQALRHLAELLAGQVGLATPIIFALFVAGTVAAVRRWRDPAWSLPAALVIPGAAVFLQHALGDRVQANWVAILYPGAALAAAGVGPRLVRPAAALGFALTAILYVQATLAPLPLSRRLDPTLRLAGFDRLAQAAAIQARQEGDTFLATEEYGLAAELAWSAPGLPVVAAEPRWRFFDLPAAIPSLPHPGLLLLSARRADGPDPAQWQVTEPRGVLIRSRSATEIETYRLFRVLPRSGALAVILPAPVRARPTTTLP